MSTAVTKVTEAEQVALSSMLQAEVVAVRQIQAILPMVADQEMRQEIEACIQTGKTHISALLAFSKEHYLI